jgi:glycosyltransferase involved in cell wall biosynthesis
MQLRVFVIWAYRAAMVSPPDRIALVHEWFLPRARGGSELVTRELDGLLADWAVQPDLFSLVEGETRQATSWLHRRRVQTSLIQRLPLSQRAVQLWLPLLPLAIEQLDLSGYPLVLSSSHLVAKGVLTDPDQLHISYVHTPVRYAWDQMATYIRHSGLAGTPLGPLLRWQLHALRQWDVTSSQRVDHLVANSRFTARRIRRCWRRSATVVHPPVAVGRFRWNQPRDAVYLSLCRLVPNKRVDLVVEAFNRTGLPLVVIGDGPERRRLQAMARPNVRLLGACGDAEATGWLERCRAYVYAGVEDFGIAPVEAMAAGAPVIAYGAGGLCDSVRCLHAGASNPTGLLFARQDVASLAAALEHFENRRLWRDLPAEGQRRWAERFAPEHFQARMLAVLERHWHRHRQWLRQQQLPVPLG